MTTNTRVLGLLLAVWGMAALLGLAGGYLTAAWLNRRDAGERA